jgi:uncharacterized protein YdaT
MPWTAERYPPSMKHLTPVVREKAIVIANALLGEGYPDGQAIRIAIARARQWAERRGVSGAGAPDPLLNGWRGDLGA